ncbi:MAG: single-stranded DNA-binding protein [Bacteroidota bacterium]
MVNKVTLIGRLGADPEVRRLESGAAVARISLATNESYKDNMGNWQDRTEWHTVIAWRIMAEKAESSFKKGNLIYVEGKITTRKWQDQNGGDRYSTEVVANYMRNIGGRENTGGGGYFPSSQDDPMTVASPSTAAVEAPSAPAAESKVTESTSNDAPIADSADDDLPF